MHKHVGHPGTWQQFLKRSDNTRIPIEEARQKYLKEQFYYDRWMATSQPALYGAGAAAGSAAFVGQGIDGPISGATVKVFDASNNLVATSTTNGVGAFTLDFVPTDMSFELTGGTDTVTGIAFTGTLKAPAGSSVISPITTAIKEVMDRHSRSEADATDYVFNYANKIYGINVSSAARERAKKENFITLGETDADMLKVAGLATIFESTAEVAGKAYSEQITGLTDATMTLKEGKESFYKSLAGLVDNYRSATQPAESISDSTAKSIREGAIRMLGFSGRPANLNQYSHINHAMDQTLNRVKEVVNDATLDKDYAMAAVMGQNRIAKQDFTSFVGTNGTVGLLFNSSSILVNTKETEAVDNLGTIFSGKQNRKAPAAARFPESINYISGSSLSQLNFGALTRAGEFNGTAYYTGVIAGETTLAWYDTTNRSWVLDNNLTLPAIAVGTTRQAYPLNRQKFRTVDNREIQLIESQAGGGGTTITVADDGSTQIASAPAGSGRYINSFYSRGATSAIDWTSVSEASISEGVATRTAQGTIRILTMDMGQTLGRFKGANPGILLTGTFTITNNVGSVLYVIAHNDTNTILNINGAGNQTVTRLSLGITLTTQVGQPTIDTTGGFNPTFMNNIAGIVEV